MKAPTTMTQAQLKAVLGYDESSGLFTWLVRPCTNTPVGSKAGAVRANGYIQIAIKGRMFLAHRLAWLYCHGHWPLHSIDHINGNRADNRIANLRDIPCGANLQNIIAARIDSSSGLRGVTWCKREGQWSAGIQINRRRINLGYFDDKHAAHAAYLAAKAVHHPHCARQLPEAAL